jgi:hypothetical protein
MPRAEGGMLIGFFFAVACIFSAPVLLVIVLFRHRVGRHIGRALVAASFASSTAYMLWRMEWFDVWRHGIPPLSYVILYVPYIAAFAAVGWLLGGAVLPAAAACAGPPAPLPSRRPAEPNRTRI